MAVIATGKISLDWDVIAGYMGEGTWARTDEFMSQDTLKCPYQHIQ